MKMNPWFDLFRYHIRLLKGKIQITDCANELSDGVLDHYRPFLKVVHHSKTQQPQVMLQVMFQVPRSSFVQSCVIPFLSIPFFAGASGFISKVFYVNDQANAFCGLYKWESEQTARSYIQSYPGTFMKLISASGSLRYHIRSVSKELS
jgi:hypothetical protein